VPDKDGVPQREHLLEVERQTGRTPLALEGPDFPELLDHVWSAFLSLNTSRGQGYSGPLPLNYQEIESWKRLTGSLLSPWEVKAIMRLDAIYLRVVSK
jgi:hypothetical protein